jgi:hypothetical protein
MNNSSNSSIIKIWQRILDLNQCFLTESKASYDPAYVSNRVSFHLVPLDESVKFPANWQDLFEKQANCPDDTDNQ